MLRSRRITVLSVALCAVFLLPGCGVRERARKWFLQPKYEQNKPEFRRRAEQQAAEDVKPEPPPSEDFSDYQPKPIPSGGDAVTDADFAPVRLKWMRRMSIDLYREMGMRDAKWDRRAEVLLDAYARYESDQPDAPSADEFAHIADEAIATGCPDPLVRLAAGDAYFRARRYTDAKAHVFIDDPEGSPDYPQMALWPAESIGWRSLSVLGPDQFNSMQALHQSFAVKLGAGLRNTEFEGEEARAAYYWIRKTMDDMYTYGWDDLYAQVNDAVDVGERTGSGPDPWLVNTILGYTDLKQAYYSRGGGFAYEVSERGAEGFRDNLKFARQHLVEAWKLHPDWPEPAALMIGVITGEKGASMAGRAWFDRALAGQIDHYPAYARYINQLLPRWGGSHEEMWDLARECLATGRYDTIVPWQAYNVARSIVFYDDATDFVARPEVYDALSKMFGGYLGTRKPAVDAAMVRTGWAGIASAVGRHREAVRLLDELGDSVDTGQLANHFARSPFGIRRLAALATTPHAAALAAAEKQRASGDLAGAIAACRQVLSAEPSQMVQSIASGRIRALQVEQKLAAGETVDLVPGFAPNECVEVAGDWEKEVSGGLVNYPDGDEQADILSPADVHDNYRLTAQIAFPPDDDRVAAGLIFSAGYPGRGLAMGSESFMGDRYGHLMRVSGTRVSPTMERQMHVNRRARISAEVYRQTFAGYIGGTTVFEGFPLMVWHEEPEKELVGLRIHYNGDVKEAVRIEQVTLEPITSTPPGWADPGIRLQSLPREWAGEMPPDRATSDAGGG